MNCPFCGVQLAEGSAFCSACGQAVKAPQQEQPVAQPAQPAEPQPVATPEQPSEVPNNQSPKKKKKIGLIIGIIAALLAVVVVVLAAIGLIFGSTIINWVKSIVMSPEDYYGSLESKSITAIIERSKDSDVDVNDVKADVSLEAELTDAGKAELNNFGIDVNQYYSGNSISADVDINAKDGKYSADTALSLGEVEIITAKAVADMATGTGAIQVPEFAEQWLAMEGVDNVDEMSPATQMVTDENRELLLELADECVKVAGKNMPEMTKDKRELRVNGVGKKYTAYTAQLNEQNMARMMNAVLKELRDNKDFKNFLENNQPVLAELLDVSEVRVISEVYRVLDEAIRETETVGSTQTVAIYTAWVDGSGRVMGRELAEMDGSVVFGFYNVLKGNPLTGYDLHTSVIANDGDVSLSGQGKIGLTKTLTEGHYTLAVESYDLVALTVNKADLKNFSKLDVTVNLSDECSELLAEEVDRAFRDEAEDMLKNYALQLVFSKGKDKVDAQLSILSGQEALLKLNVSSSLHKGEEVTMPSSVVDEKQYENNFDDDRVLNELLDKLERAGVKTDDIEKNLSNGGSQSNNKNSYSGYTIR